MVLHAGNTGSAPLRTACQTPAKQPSVGLPVFCFLGTYFTFLITRFLHVIQVQQMTFLDVGSDGRRIQSSDTLQETN